MPPSCDKNPRPGREIACEVVEPTPQGDKSPSGPPIRLANADEIRIEMAKVYRQAKNGQIGMQDATRLVWILGELGKAHERAVLEHRLDTLEQAARSAGRIS
jgi:hypothetical protein